MKKFLTAAIAMSVLASTATAGVANAAQPYRPNDRYEQRHQPPKKAPAPSVKRHDDRGHHYRKGERLPQAYRGAAYKVDHRKHKLKAPPRGHEYRKVGNDVILVAIATGIITSVLINQLN